MLKVVIDTNVFISGVLTEGGNPSLIIKVWRRTRKYQLFITEKIIQEVLRVMRKLNLSADIIRDWDRGIRKNAIKVSPARKIEFIKKDPPDDMFLECAIEAHADYIVSGDDHLKKLNEFEGIEIITPKKFLDILKDYKEHEEDT